jgi:hypothetical protein
MSAEAVSGGDGRATYHSCRHFPLPVCGAEQRARWAIFKTCE